MKGAHIFGGLASLDLGVADDLDGLLLGEHHPLLGLLLEEDQTRPPIAKVKVGPLEVPAVHSRAADGHEGEATVEQAALVAAAALDRVRLVRRQLRIVHEEEALVAEVHLIILRRVTVEELLGLADGVEAVVAVAEAEEAPNAEHEDEEDRARAHRLGRVETAAVARAAEAVEAFA